MKPNLPVNADRLWSDVMALAEITDRARPYTRRSFSPLFLQGRAFLVKRFAEAGLETRIDAGGNLIGRRQGNDPKLGVIALGSHTDTVPSGGRFDGIAGVATGLEVARTLDDANIRLDHTIEVIDFLAEEPSEYGLSCVGSRAMAGALDAKMLTLAAPSGEQLGDALRRVGGNPEKLGPAGRGDIKAFLELHIEQGIVLESQSLDVGIVTAIAGIRRIELIFEGAADHAGTTPLGLRHDALVAASRTVVSVRERAEQLAGKTGGYFVATVGILAVEPGAANVVPQRTRLVIDTRTTDPALTTCFVDMIDRDSAAHAVATRVRRVAFTTLSDSQPVVCAPALRDVLREGARSLGLRHCDLASGAGHDTAFMSRICPSAMVFVPSKAGKSHVPEEWTKRDELAAGAAVMFEALRSLDKSLPREGGPNVGR